MNKRSVRAAFLLVGVVSVTAFIAGCDDEVVQSSAPPPRARAAAAASASASASASVRVFAEADFTPSERNRDPFRNYPEMFAGDQGRGGSAGARQQKIIADRFALDELKLVGIVTGGTQARAMFVDPERTGHIVTVGQLVGRSELVKAGGVTGPEYDLNWKVERIRDKDVVFVRDNPGRNIATATRVVALRPEGDNGDVRKLARHTSVRARTISLADCLAAERRFARAAGGESCAHFWPLFRKSTP